MSQLTLPHDHDGGMVKLCSWSAFSPDMEPYVELLPTTGAGTRTRFARKVAAQLRSKSAAELVRKFAAEVEPRPNSHYFLSTALGAYDYWGANNNGDAFEESELKKEAEDVGYRSFVKHARVYQHHRNKDPSRAMGRVVLASYNDRMHRVELIEELDNVKAAAYIRRWYEQGSLPTSMGCKIAFDVCSICGNKAKTASVYCEHAKYAMKRTLMDGRKVCVFNPNPRFFDQSHVNVPADKIAGVMEKVASVSFAGVDLPWDAMREEGALLSAVHGEAVFGGQESDDSATPSGAVKVASAAEDEPAGAEMAIGCELSDHALETVKVATDREPVLPLEVLEKLAEFPLEEATATMLQLGILPSPAEWQFMALCASGQSKVAHELHEARTCFQPDPGLEAADDADRCFVAEWNVRPELVEKLAGFIPTRSFRPEFLSPRLAEASELVKEGAERVVQPWEIRQENPSIAKTMLALAASYGIVRQLAGSDASLAKGLKDLTGTHPAIAGALLSAGIAAGLVTADRVAGRATETELGPNGEYTKLSCLLGDVEEGEKLAASAEKAMSVAEWLGKTPKSVRDVVLPSTAFSAGFLGSSYYRAKQLRGQPTTSGQNVMADHPLGSAIGATAGYALVRRGLRKARRAL